MIMRSLGRGRVTNACTLFQPHSIPRLLFPTPLTLSVLPPSILLVTLCTSYRPPPHQYPSPCITVHHHPTHQPCSTHTKVSPFHPTHIQTRATNFSIVLTSRKYGVATVW